MSLHSELLKQARFLARKEPGKPTQASLRRSVSASYHALFHLLVDEAARLLPSSHGRRPLCNSLARAFHHSGMKQTAVEFTWKPMSPRLPSGFIRQPGRQPPSDVASAFLPLQEARHDADYGGALRFTRKEAQDLVADPAAQAFRYRDLVRSNRCFPRRASRLVSHAGTNIRARGTIGPSGKLISSPPAHR